VASIAGPPHLLHFLFTTSMKDLSSAAAAERTCITQAVDNDAVEPHRRLDDLQLISAAAFRRRLRDEQHVGEQHATDVQLKTRDHPPRSLHITHLITIRYDTKKTTRTHQEMR